MQAAEILDAAPDARIILILGDKDTGKTTCTTNLANECLRRGHSVGIIDTDIGQSDIGPPTTIGVGIVESRLDTLRNAALQHLYFVGATSPKGHLLPMIVGTQKMLAKATARGLQKILIDTTGLVSGQLGRVLKQHKIDLVNPDLILCLQRAAECEHILAPYAHFETPRILRCSPDPHCRSKTPADRQQYRHNQFRQYFAHAREIECSLNDIGLFGTRLFSGRPASPDTLTHSLQQITGETRADFPANSHSPGSPNTPNIFWAERLNRELLLITAKKLSCQLFLKLKNTHQGIDYIHNVTLDEFQNLLVGVLDESRECRSLGLLRSIDFPARKATLLTPAPRQAIAGLTFSRHHLSL
ncbi:hypothetical protein GF339_02045 [candidate division KSB3 bacterium]|uniref:Clp1 P-loop domain-containing protein n=1 Tax=candidate division KSB3 bacterium TaxID=2044937 RepID=A0A9D5JSE2_9BACT|nr:hypothetical protein [candidate division KSB3 bacterium]MBD3323333.1 hypothetical protein [candidate division KSB3 bacterium]